MDYNHHHETKAISLHHCSMFTQTSHWF